VLNSLLQDKSCNIFTVSIRTLAHREGYYSKARFKGPVYINTNEMGNFLLVEQHYDRSNLKCNFLGSFMPHNLVFPL